MICHSEISVIGTVLIFDRRLFAPFSSAIEYFVCKQKTNFSRHITSVFLKVIFSCRIHLESFISTYCFFFSSSRFHKIPRVWLFRFPISIFTLFHSNRQSCDQAWLREGNDTRKLIMIAKCLLTLVKFESLFVLTLGTPSVPPLNVKHLFETALSNHSMLNSKPIKFA